MPSRKKKKKKKKTGSYIIHVTFYTFKGYFLNNFVNIAMRKRKC